MESAIRYALFALLGAVTPYVVVLTKSTWVCGESWVLSVCGSVCCGIRGCGGSWPVLSVVVVRPVGGGICWCVGVLYVVKKSCVCRFVRPQLWVVIGVGCYCL